MSADNGRVKGTLAEQAVFPHQAVSVPCFGAMSDSSRIEKRFRSRERLQSGFLMLPFLP
jgi:hypothetical protein